MRIFAKFRADRSNHCRDMAISISQDAGRSPSWFYKFEMLTADTIGRVNVHHHATFHADRSSRCFSILFQNGGHTPSWICYTRV